MIDDDTLFYARFSVSPTSESCPAHRRDAPHIALIFCRKESPGGRAMPETGGAMPWLGLGLEDLTPAA